MIAASRSAKTWSVAYAPGSYLRGESRGREQPTLLLHGGGQDRQSWWAAMDGLDSDARPWTAYDLRGHGRSDWSESGSYSFDDHVADLKLVLAERGPVGVIVGASAGGLTALLALGEGQDHASAPLATGLVLVEAAPTMAADGVGRVKQFMIASPRGFATLDEAADVMARLLPSRRGSASSLTRHLVRRDDGRYHWRWDPRLLAGLEPPTAALHERLSRAAARLSLPLLLVRGERSDVVTQEAADELSALAPQCEVVQVAGAGHTPAGGENSRFYDAFRAFVARVSDG